VRCLALGRFSRSAPRTELGRVGGSRPRRGSTTRGPQRQLACRRQRKRPKSQALLQLALDLRSETVKTNEKEQEEIVARVRQSF